MTATLAALLSRAKKANVFSKLLAAFFLFANIVVLTQSPIDESHKEIVSKFLTLNGIVSSVLSFAFFSTYFEAAENKTDAPRISGLLIATVAVATYFLASLFLDASFIAVTIFLPAMLVYSFSGHLDAIIMQSDAAGNRSRPYEAYRVIFRFGLVAISIATLLFMDQFNFVDSGDLPEQTRLILPAGLAIAAFALWLAYRPPFNITVYKLTLLVGNVFWNLPRILLEKQGHHTEVLQLSFLLAVGQGAILVANYFYGMLLSTSFNRRLSSALIAVAVLLAVFVVSLTTTVFGSATAHIAVSLALLTYALGGLLQTAARAKCATKRGNRTASTIYLVSLVMGFPLVTFVAMQSPIPANIVAAICFVQLFRSSLYEISSSTK